MRLGVRYSPEWDRDDRATEDARLMKRAGLNAACVGTAMWDRIEPSQGRYTFDWLDGVVAALADQAIAVFLCVPINMPPSWAFAKYPEIGRTDVHGIKAGIGGPLCFTGSSFRTLAQELARALARRYGDDDRVTGWRIETYAAEPCYCERCEQGFRGRLVHRYAREDALSDAWGVRIRAWNEIGVPRGRAPHPSHALEFARFTADSQQAFYTEVCAALSDNIVDQSVIRDFTPDANDKNVSYAVETESRSAGWLAASFRAERVRPMSDRYTFVESLGDGVRPTPTAGALRRWIWQGVANGAERTFCGSWRTPRTGPAMGAHGLLKPDGEPAAAYKEVRRTADELKRIIPKINGARVEPKIALLVQRDAELLASTPAALPDVGAETVCRDWYAAIKRTGHNCDVVTPGQDLSTYKLVLAPWLPFVDDALADQLERYVKAGGRVVFGPGSGARTMHNTLRDVPAPGLLLPIAGITVEETVVTEPSESMTVSFPRGALIAQRVDVQGRIEVLDAMTAQTVCEYASGRLAGKAAITRYVLEKGEVHYIGAHLPGETLFAFLRDLAPEYPMKNIPEGVEVTQRRTKDHRFVFILNHTPERQTVTLPKACLDLLTEQKVGPDVTLSANGVLILRS